MADNVSSTLSALMNVPMSEAVPFGAGAAPQGGDNYITHTLKALWGLPQRAMEASGRDLQHLGDTSQDLETVGPAVETALNMARAGAPHAEPGAVGMFGGKLSQTANLEKLAQAQRMLGKEQDPNMVRQLTGWFQGPDKNWMYEIPDERSKMIKPAGWDTAGNMFHHPDLYQAYPQMKNFSMFSEVDPTYPSNTGMWTPKSAAMELSSKTPAEARLGALHEMQHAVQNIEGWSPGTSQQAWQMMKDQHPETYDRAASLVGKDTPFDMYNHTVGEVQARNVEKRADFNPQQRYEKSPWETADFIPNKQLAIPPLTDPDMLRLLRGGK